MLERRPIFRLPAEKESSAWELSWVQTNMQNKIIALTVNVDVELRSYKNLEIGTNTLTPLENAK